MLITVQLNDSEGVPLTAGGDTVELSSTGGTLAAENDNLNGTYSADLLVDEDLTAITVSGKVNSEEIPATVRIGVKVSVNTDLSELAMLGEKIFTDENLSTPTGQSCASCHDIASGTFIDILDDDNDGLSNATSEGAEPGEFGGRNSPTIAYSAHSPEQYHYIGRTIGGQFWDGRADSLEEQARQPFFN